MNQQPVLPIQNRGRVPRLFRCLGLLLGGAVGGLVDLVVVPAGLLDAELVARRGGGVGDVVGVGRTAAVVHVRVLLFARNVERGIGVVCDARHGRGVVVGHGGNRGRGRGGREKLAARGRRMGVGGVIFSRPTWMP